MDQPELQKEKGPIGVICAPTRELAHQIYLESKKFAKSHGIRVSAIYGGMSKCLDQNLNFGLKEGAGPKRGPKGKTAKAQSKPRRQKRAFPDLVQLMKTTCLPTQGPSDID
ncbi:hypothetical protein COP1_025841 [Malus domestica]